MLCHLTKSVLLSIWACPPSPPLWTMLKKAAKLVERNIPGQIGQKCIWFSFPSLYLFSNKTFLFRFKLKCVFHVSLALCNIWYVYDQICHHFHFSQFMSKHDIRPQILVVNHSQGSNIWSHLKCIKACAWFNGKTILLQGNLHSKMTIDGAIEVREEDELSCT